jgi:hypothetical protein
MSLMPVYSRKWEQLRHNQIPLLRPWHNLPRNRGLLPAKRVLVFHPVEVLLSLSCRSNNLLKVPVDFSFYVKAPSQQSTGSHWFVRVALEAGLARLCGMILVGR